jgi:hypothetical protein
MSQFDNNIYKIIIRKLKDNAVCYTHRDGRSRESCGIFIENEGRSKFWVEMGRDLR